jgi:uncharacterized membrane protein
MAQQFLNSKPVKLAVSAIFTALVFVATVVFSSYVPQTTGFFNIGETMVYITAILFGPLVGAFAGGVGSMLADLFLGYPHFAPATLVIKGCEGAVVGLLSRRKLELSSRLHWKVFTFVVGLVVGVLLAGVGSVYYSGSVELYVGIPLPAVPNFVLSIPPVFWYGLGTIVTFLVALMGFVFDPEFGWLILSIIIGGLVLVSGYYLYEQLFLGVAALAEVPFNVGQMSVGLVVAIPIVRAVWRYLPSLRA